MALKLWSSRRALSPRVSRACNCAGRSPEPAARRRHGQRQHGQGEMTASQWGLSYQPTSWSGGRNFRHPRGLTWYSGTPSETGPRRPGGLTSGPRGGAHQRCPPGSSSPAPSWSAEHQRMVVQLAMNLLSDRDEALDLSQEVFLRVFRTIHRFRGHRVSALDLPHRGDQARQPAPVLAPAHRQDRSRSISTLPRTAIFSRRASRRPIVCSRRRSWESVSRRRSTTCRSTSGRRCAAEIGRPELREIAAFSLGVVGRHRQIASHARPSGAAARAAQRGLHEDAELRFDAPSLQAFHRRAREIGEQSHERAQSNGVRRCARALADVRDVGSALQAICRDG